MSRQIVLDTETTGLEPSKGHRIVEIGCIEIINRQITERYFHHYLNPERAIEAGAQMVHGITDDLLKDKPKFSEIIDELLAFIKDAEVIIHNAPFDVGFLNHELKLSKRKLGVITDYCRVTDTLAMAREMHPGQRNNLDALCKRYGVDNSNRDLHGGLLDAELLALTYLAMTSGQDSLFAELEVNDKPTAAETRVTTSVNNALPVLAANAEELTAHSDIMQRLVKADLW